MWRSHDGKPREVFEVDCELGRCFLGAAVGPAAWTMMSSLVSFSMEVHLRLYSLEVERKVIRMTFHSHLTDNHRNHIEKVVAEFNRYASGLASSGETC